MTRERGGAGWPAWLRVNGGLAKSTACLFLQHTELTGLSRLCQQLLINYDNDRGRTETTISVCVNSNELSRLSTAAERLSRGGGGGE